MLQMWAVAPAMMSRRAAVPYDERTCAVVPTCWADVGRGTHMMSRRALRYPHDERTCAVVPTCWQDVRRGTHIASPETPGEPSIRNFPACSETIDTVFRAYTNMNGCTLNPVPYLLPGPTTHLPSSRNSRRAFEPRLVSLEKRPRTCSLTNRYSRN